MGNDQQKGVEIVGDTVEDAINQAVSTLNVPKDSLNIKIVCEEKKGLFGMGGEKCAKIVVTLKENKA